MSDRVARTRLPVASAAVLALALLASLAAAAGAEPTAPATASREALIEQVRQSEIAFAATVAARDKMRFAAMIAADAVFVGSNGATRGRDAIVAAWAPFFEPSAPTFEWHPGDRRAHRRRLPRLHPRPLDARAARTPRAIRWSSTGVFNSVWRRQPRRRLAGHLRRRLLPLPDL